MKRRIVLALSLLVVLALALTACGNKATPLNQRHSSANRR